MNEIQRKLNDIQTMLSGLYDGGDITEAARSSLQYTLNEAQKVVKNITYEPVLATGRKTRADRRNEKAEKVCREARYQLFMHGGIADNNRLSDLVLDWLKYGRKICYKRP